METGFNATTFETGLIRIFYPEPGAPILNNKFCVSSLFLGCGGRNITTIDSWKTAMNIILKYPDVWEIVQGDKEWIFSACCYFTLDAIDGSEKGMIETVDFYMFLIEEGLSLDRIQHQLIDRYGEFRSRTTDWIWNELRKRLEDKKAIDEMITHLSIT